jgi:hypothetical protein
MGAIPATSVFGLDPLWQTGIAQTKPLDNIVQWLCFVLITDIFPT